MLALSWLPFLSSFHACFPPQFACVRAQIRDQRAACWACPIDINLAVAACVLCWPGLVVCRVELGRLIKADNRKRAIDSKTAAASREG
jgi:hypothetical protein